MVSVDCTNPSYTTYGYNTQWQAVLEKAIRHGNQVHDVLFDQEGVIVTVEEGIELAGDQSQVRQIYQEYNVFGTNPLSQLETVIRFSTAAKSFVSCFGVNSMAMLIILDSQGTLIFIDSHVHMTTSHCFKCVPQIPGSLSIHIFTLLFLLIIYSAYDNTACF